MWFNFFECGTKNVCFDWPKKEKKTHVTQIEKMNSSSYQNMNIDYYAYTLHRE